MKVTHIKQCEFLADFKLRYPDYWRVVPELITQEEHSLDEIWKKRTQVYALIEAHKQMPAAQRRLQARSRSASPKRFRAPVLPGSGSASGL